MEHSFQKIWLSKGDEDSILSLYNLYYSDLYNYGYRISVNEDLTRDAIHDLFIRIWDGKVNLESVQSPKPYLLKSLRYILIDALNKSSKSIDLQREGIYEYVLSEEDILIHAEYSEENKVKLRKAVMNLPPKQKEVIYLRYYEGLDYNEIAEVTDTKNQSVRNLMSKALSELRKYFSVLIVWLLSAENFFHS